MFKFMQFNQTKRYVAQKFCSFLCNFTCYKSVTKILQNGYKWLQTCNHTNFAKVVGAVSIIYAGRAGIYARKGAANELRLRSCIELHRSCIWNHIWSCVWELRLGATNAAAKLI